MRTSSLSPLRRFGFCLIVALPLLACDSGDAPADSGAPEDAAKAAQAGDEGKLSELVEREIQNADADESTKTQVRNFMKDQRKLACEMLTPAMVASTLDVPADGLKQTKVMGCIYNWDEGDQMAQASLMSIWIKKTPEDAKRWFENSTKNLTKEELQAQMKMVTERTKKSKSIDTDTKKKTVDAVGGLAGGMMPDEGYQYEDVSGVGDAARVKVYDGSLTVRVGNMIFNVSAYKGPQPPPPDQKLIMTGDVKKIMEATKAAEKINMDATREQRKEMAIKLAKLIVDAL